MLAAAITAAHQAAEAAKLQKEKVRARAQELITQAQAAINADKELLRKAPKGKVGRATVETMQSGLAAIESSLAQADSALRHGDFLTARYKAKACLDNANAIGEELQNAIEKKVTLTAKSRY